MSPQKKSQVVAIKGPVCAALMSARAVRRDLPTVGENRANLGCRCKWQKSAGDGRSRERGAEIDGRPSAGSEGGNSLLIAAAEQEVPPPNPPPD